MISTPNNSEQVPSTVILRETEDGWAALLGRFEGGKLVRLDTKHFTRNDDAETESKVDLAGDDGEETIVTSELDQWLAENEITQVHTLLSGARTITRVLELNVTEEEEVDTYELTMAQGDLGRVIGRQGRTARAMRAVLRAATAKQGRRAHLEILD